MRSLNNATSHSFAQFKKECIARRCVLFGVGPYAKNILTSIEKSGVVVDYIVDESFLNWGRKIKGCAVCPPSRLKNENPEEIVILIGTHEIERMRKLSERLGMICMFAYYLFFEKMYDEENIEGYTVYL